MSGYGRLQNNNNMTDNDTGVMKPGPPPNNVEFFPRSRTPINNLFSPLNLNNNTSNNISSKDSNFLKRILVTLKTITDDNIYENVIFNYKKILKLPTDPSKLTNDDLRTFIPKRQNNTRKTFNYLFGKETNNLNRRYSNKNNRTVRNYMKQTITASQIQTYQINAYNELLALLLVLMEKAFDKFTNNTIFSRVKSKLRGFLRTNDQSGVLKINDLNLDYVKDILGYNINKNKTSIKKHLISNTDIKEGILSGLSSITLLALNHIIVFGYSINYCPANVNEPLTLGTVISKDTGKYICKYIKGTEKFVSNVANLVPLIENALIVGSMGANAIAMISLLQGAPIAMYLGYTMYSMYKHEQKNIRLKDIFIQIHETIFDESNTLKFENIKDELFIYNSISFEEKNILNSYPSININNQPSKPLGKYANLNNSPNHDLIGKYIERFIKERLRYRTDLYAISLAQDNLDKLDLNNHTKVDIVENIFDMPVKETDKLLGELGIIDNRPINPFNNMPNNGNNLFNQFN
jgi:hypothetical protein